jgi:transposase
MLGLPSSVRIFLCVTPVDMRRSFDSLAENVRQMLGEDPLSGHLFIFRNKEETKMKILYWDRDGFAIWYKRLEKGRFNLPRSGGRGLEVDLTELSMMLTGLESSTLLRQERYPGGRGIKGAGIVGASV